MSRSTASLLGVKFGGSQMTSHAGGGYGNVWYKLVYIHDAWAGGAG